MKKFLILVFCLFILNVSAEETVSTVSTPISKLTVPKSISFTECYKIYKLNPEQLFYLSLAAFSANKFQINEMQTAGGYIIFTANRNKYLATIAKVDNDYSILKITPCNNIYNFPPGIIDNSFKYIDISLISKTQ